MLLGQKGKGSAGEYKVLIFVDNYRGISSRSRPPEEESQRNDDNVEEINKTVDTKNEEDFLCLY